MHGATTTEEIDVGDQKFSIAHTKFRASSAR